MNEPLRILIVSSRGEVRSRLFAEIGSLIVERDIQVTVSGPPRTADADGWVEHELVRGTAVFVDLESEPNASDQVRWLIERAVEPVAIVGLLPQDRVAEDTPDWLALGVTEVHPIEDTTAAGLESVARRAVARVRSEKAKLGLRSHIDDRTVKEFELLLRHARDIVVLRLDPEGNIEMWNAGAERTFGYSAPEVIGKSFEFLFSEADRNSGVPQQELERAKRTGWASDNRWHVHRDGSALWVEGSTVSMYIGMELVGYFKIVQDQTAIRTRHEMVLKERERLQLALETAKFGTWEYDIARRTFGLDHRVREWFDIVKEGPVPAQSVLARVVHEDRAQIERTLSQAETAAPGQEFAMEFRIRSARGEVLWLTMPGFFVPVSELEPSPQLYGVCVNITSDRQAQASLATANQSLQRQARKAIHSADLTQLNVAHTLHENVQQILAAAKFAFSALNYRYESAERNHDNVLEMINQAFDATMDLVRTLIPPLIVEQGLCEALQSLAGYDEYRAYLSLECAEGPSLFSEMPIERQVFVYRTVRELTHQSLRMQVAEKLEVGLQRYQETSMVMQARLENSTLADLSRANWPEAMVDYFADVEQEALLLGGELELTKAEPRTLIFEVRLPAK